MKKFKILILLAAIGLIPVLSQAQSFHSRKKTKVDRKNVVKVNILSPILRTGAGFYERKISDKISLQLGGSYTGFSYEDVALSAWSVTPEMRYYPGEGLQGFYLGPYVRIREASLNVPVEIPNTEGEMQSKEVTGRLSTKSGGLLLGYQRLFGNRVSLDVFAGPSFNSNSLSADVDDFEDIDKVENIMDWVGLLGWNAIGLRGGITLGVAF